MVADDQFVIQQVMTIILSELGLADRMISCKNGEEVVDFFKIYLDGLKGNTRSSEVRD